MTLPRVWFITGTSSGFGRAVTELVLKNGEIVIATLRKPDILSDLQIKYGQDKLLVIGVDVTKHGDIEAAFERAKETFGQINVVFNNAGYGHLSEVEGTPDDVAHTIFDVNFWGAVHVTRGAIKFFREVNKPGIGGILLQASTLAALIPMPGASFYGASKHALEGFSEGLAGELLPAWNIKICIINLGIFHTNVMSSALVLPQHPAYSDPASATTIFRKHILDAVLPGDVNKGASAIYKLVDSGQIPLRLPLGQDCVQNYKQKIENLTESVTGYESWSDDLKRDGI
ncbi:hypothetical protein SERLA73DRAFT_191351 [Serpula lacrymans var. lacrymans S7.3]|uniref:NAD(P)-binding protein n=2 Tax=Serpula lacrymans var. lacrymans TaxID=341189 RepID=F8QHC5_SERL3|nr:uncharacterized protein SERLADRAFT_477640 [Serpula lacrymans var. lacrymans S7.9]EGN92308.1 hypothetical protein SERLA73DRAFT_191351 [Serpula lacrymans var. lacrymans S7.3]EGO20251.1 hypothetical protein SERLADRAFT_477640 [Serpula lacrymans var. lacrymans S7.9]